MRLDISIENPIIEVKPNPSEKTYLLVNLGKIGIMSDRICDESRIVEKG